MSAQWWQVFILPFESFSKFDAYSYSVFLKESFSIEKYFILRFQWVFNAKLNLFYRREANIWTIQRRAPSCRFPIGWAFALVAVNFKDFSWHASEGGIFELISGKLFHWPRCSWVHADFQTTFKCASSDSYESISSKVIRLIKLYWNALPVSVQKQELQSDFQCVPGVHCWLSRDRLRFKPGIVMHCFLVHKATPRESFFRNDWKSP